MNRIDIEEWAYRIVEKAERARPIEDDRVELKAHWPEARDIARQLCAHANAARADEILWLLGVDETKGVVSFSSRDMANWRAQLEAEFEGGAPLLQHFTLDWNGSTFIALLFRTDAPPYVVRNPKRNESGSGPFELEVSWRDGSRTRAARRAELILLLRPIARLPSVSPQDGDVRVMLDGTLHFNVHFYVASDSLERIVIPEHYATFTSGIVSVPLYGFNLHPDGRDPDVVATRSHLTINGAGRVSCNGMGSAPVGFEFAQSAVFEVRLRVAGAERYATGRALLERYPPDNPNTFGLWLLRRGGPSNIS